QRPPGPPTRWFGLSKIGEIQRDLIGFYQRLQGDYGDAVFMQIGPYQDYSFFHPDQIHEVLIEKAKAFVRFKRPLDVLKQWNGDGVLITEGEKWLSHRRLLQPAFSVKRFGGYADAVVATASTQFSQAAPQETTLDFEAAMTDLTTSVICRTMFGSDLGDRMPDMRRAVQILSKVAVEEMFQPFTWPDWLPLPGKAEKKWAINLIDQTVRGFIRQRRDSGGDTGDLLSMLLLAADEEGDGRRLTDEQARDQCVTIFLAGHDTTAAGLAWLGWVLATHPDYTERLAADIISVLGDRPPTFADLPKLAAVERAVKESLRLYPPAIAVFARQAVKDVEIGGWTVPRGGVVRLMTYITHHDPRWFPDPETFDPDRFLPERWAALPPCAYVPFGAGPRVCLGQSFAMMEMTLIATLLLQRYRITPAQTKPELNPSMSLRPIGGMRVKLTPRTSMSGVNSP
ncbi:MAG TPA: cytochrome P450, partial [Planctomycetaceae bacterium]|nr:cytochrome P450 [Planctomycetaceae bacterium]